jgi:flavin reductase (DIM6/NTAB) family NADH-FMN oxidoreductase RutF
MFSAGKREDQLKHTTENVLENEEFVFNLVTESIAEQMDQTSANLEKKESEFRFADLTPEECKKISVSRVAESPVSLECILHDSIDIYDNTICFGRVIYAHVDDELMNDGKIDVTKIDSVGRLSGSYYTGIRQLNVERSY